MHEIGKVESAFPRAPAEAHGDQREAFDAAFLSWNGFHTKAELDAEWEKGLSGVMFRAALKAKAPAPAPVVRKPNGFELVDGEVELSYEDVQSPAPVALVAAAQELSDFFWSENLGHVPGSLVANLRDALSGQPKPEAVEGGVEPTNAAQAYAMARVLLDVHAALGCEWGDNIYKVIADLKSAHQPRARRPAPRPSVALPPSGVSND